MPSKTFSVSRMAGRVAATAALMIASSPAQADLTVCNQTDYPVGAAIAYQQNTNWISQGWWSLEAGQCKVLLAGPLAAQYYYLHAVHYQVGGLWLGPHEFCTEAKTFTIIGRETCQARGFKPTGFLQIDTAEAQDWRHDLSQRDPDQP